MEACHLKNTKATNNTHDRGVKLGPLFDMKTLKVIRWLAHNSALAFLAYKAVIDNSEGFARVYQFWMWFATTAFFITAFSHELRLKHKKEPSVPVPLDNFVDIAFCLFFIYHGWWMTGIVSVISAVAAKKFYEKEDA